MKKKFLIISLLFCTLFIATACSCSNKKASEENKKENINVEKITIEVPSSDVNFEIVPGENDTATIETGKSFTLIIGIGPEDATNKDLTWNVSDDTILDIDSNGKVTALKEGEATISATSNDGKVKSNEIEIKVLGETNNDSE